MHRRRHRRSLRETHGVTRYYPSIHPELVHRHHGYGLSCSGLKLSGLRGWIRYLQSDGLREGIDDTDAGLLEIYAVARDDGQVVDEGGGGDKAVLDGHSSPGGAKTCEQLRLPRQT